MRQNHKRKDKQAHIKTQQVFTEQNQVFTKSETEDWFSVSFQWVPIS